MSNNQTIAQRIKDWRGLCASNGITYKEAIKRADLPYDSVKNNMRDNNISNERMTLLEESALAIRAERKLQPANQ